MRDVVKLGCALTLGLAIAFPAGMMFAGRRTSPDLPAAPASAERRRTFSPVVTRDPYFLQQQRENAAALERQCRQTGELCREARQVRAWVEQEVTGD